MKQYQTSTHQPKEKTTKKKRHLPQGPLAVARPKKVAKTTQVIKDAVPEPCNPPSWTTKVTPSPTASSSTSRPAGEGLPVPESDLKITKLLQQSFQEVKEEPQNLEVMGTTMECGVKKMSIKLESWGCRWIGSNPSPPHHLSLYPSFVVPQVFGCPQFFRCG